MELTWTLAVFLLTLAFIISLSGKTRQQLQNQTLTREVPNGKTEEPVDQFWQRFQSR